MGFAASGPVTQRQLQSGPCAVHPFAVCLDKLPLTWPATKATARHSRSPVHYLHRSIIAFNACVSENLPVCTQGYPWSLARPLSIIFCAPTVVVDVRGKEFVRAGKDRMHLRWPRQGVLVISWYTQEITQQARYACRSRGEPPVLGLSNKQERVTLFE